MAVFFFLPLREMLEAPVIIGIVRYEVLYTPSHTEQSAPIPSHDDLPFRKAAMLGATAYAAAIILSGRRYH